MSKGIDVRCLLPALMIVVLAVSPVQAADPLKYRLANGLTVILIPDDRAIAASMMVWVKVGSASEFPGEYGAAHLLEHILFNRPEPGASGEKPPWAENFTGRPEAFTSHDRTVVHMETTAPFIGRDLSVMATRLFDPDIDPAVFALEKGNIIKEIDIQRQRPAKRLAEAVQAEAFRIHPYGRSIEGPESSLAGLSREMVLSFYRRWYTPANMVLVLAGDFDPEEARRQVERSFGVLDRRHIPLARRLSEPNQENTRIVVIGADVALARLNLAFHIPESKSDDTAAFDLLIKILDHRLAARLTSAVKGPAMVRSVGLDAFRARDPGLLNIEAVLAQSDVKPVLKTMLTEIMALSYTEVSPDELTAARADILQAFHVSQAASRGRAGTAACFEALHGDFHAASAYLAELDKVSPAALKSTAARYLRPDNLTLGVIAPTAAAADLSEESLLAAVRVGTAQKFPAAVSPAFKSRKESRVSASTVWFGNIGNGLEKSNAYQTRLAGLSGNAAPGEADTDQYLNARMFLFEQ